jgi:DNA-binding HxlR family transcriptional regulator
MIKMSENKNNNHYDYSNTINNNNNENVNVSITIGDIKVQFNGSAQSVMTSVITFLTKQLPTIDLAKKISLNYAATELIETYSNLIKITPEGPRVIPVLDEESGMKKLSDKEMVALQLIASKIAKDIGKISDDAMQASKIQSAMTIKSKSVSSRLSELVKAGYVARDNTKDDSAVVYRITTLGIHWLGSTLSKRAKTTSLQSSL